LELVFLRGLFVPNVSVESVEKTLEGSIFSVKARCRWTRQFLLPGPQDDSVPASSFTFVHLIILSE
jgi:hypothetical protein